MVRNGRFYHDFSQMGTADRVAGMIVRSGFSDRELSELLHVSIQAVNKWRHGKSIPDIDNLVSLSQIFGVRIDDFLVCERISDEVFLRHAQILPQECCSDQVLGVERKEQISISKAG